MHLKTGRFLNSCGATGKCYSQSDLEESRSGSKRLRPVFPVVSGLTQEGGGNAPALMAGRRVTGNGLEVSACQWRCLGCALTLAFQRRSDQNTERTRG